MYTEMHRRSILVLCGPSGAGKSTLIKRLMKERASRFGFSVSHTTRKPREGEIDGVDYHFVSKEYMQDVISQGKFVETAEVHGNYYGTSYEAIRTVINSIPPKMCILDIDVQGVDNVKKSEIAKDCYFMFLGPPSLQHLEDRLRSRGTETEEAIQRRLHNAAIEMKYKDIPNFWDSIIENDNIDETYEKFRSIVLPMVTPDAVETCVMSNGAANVHGNNMVLCKQGL